MSEELKTIILTIGGEDFEIQCAPENEQNLHHAAEHLDDAIGQIQRSSDHRAISLEKAAVYVALNLASEILTKQAEQDLSLKNTKKRYSRLIREIESVIAA